LHLLATQLSRRGMRMPCKDKAEKRREVRVRKEI